MKKNLNDKKSVPYALLFQKNVVSLQYISAWQLHIVCACNFELIETWNYKVPSYQLSVNVAVVSRISKME